MSAIVSKYYTQHNGLFYRYHERGAGKDGMIPYWEISNHPLDIWWKWSFNANVYRIDQALERARLEMESDALENMARSISSAIGIHTPVALLPMTIKLPQPYELV
jgi:hypothetical protein